MARNDYPVPPGIGAYFRGSGGQRLQQAHAGYQMPTQTKHVHGDLRAEIVVIGGDTNLPFYMGCFGWTVDESQESIETRWNELAEMMWRYGVEPIQDEPWYSTVEDGVTWDHYPLRETEPECDGCHD